MNPSPCPGVMRRTCRSVRGLLSSLLVLFAFTATAQTTYQIGSGTSTSAFLPIYSCYDFNYSQQIYTAAELNTAGAVGGQVISKVRFHYANGGSTSNWNNWTIYLGNTSLSSLATESSWLPVSTLTQVYSGTFTPVAGTWIEFTLSTPFTWDGTSNLLVAVDENSSGYSCTANWLSFTDTSMPYRGILYYADGDNADPNSPPAANYTSGTIRAQVQFEMTPDAACNGTPAPGNTNTTLASGCAGSAFTLSLQNSTSGSGVTYEWQSGPSASGPWTTIGSATNATYSSTVSGSNYYICNVTCAGNTTASNPVQVSEVSCCNYTLRLTDSYGDGWNGASVQVRNGTTVLATAGSTFTTGAGPVDVLVNLPDASSLNLYWAAGGSYPGEVGFQLIDPFGVTLFTKPAGTGTAPSQVHDFVSNCTPPACPSVTGLTASATNAISANVTWTCASCTGNFIVEYGAPGFTPGTGLTAGAGGTIASTTATSPFTLSGLSGSTAYSIVVRQDCGGLYSINMSTNATTPPGCGDNFYDSGGASGTYGNGENRTITICPNNPGEVVTLTFLSVALEDCCDNLSVYDANTVSGPAIDVPPGTTPIITALNPSGCLTITFTSDGSIVADGWNALVSCAPAPTCPQPTSAAASTVTAISAEANWTNNGGGGTFIVEYGPAATFTTPGTDANPGTGGTVILNATAPQLIGGLNPTTQYRYFVRQDCGAGDFSTNSNGQVFTTLAEPPNCATAPMLSCNTPTTAVFAAATGVWNSNSCGWGTPGAEKVYQFVAPVAGTYGLQLISNTGMYVDYSWKSASGTCDATGWTCIDDLYTVSTVNFTVPAAGTYLILADPEGTGAVTHEFQIVCPCLPGTATASAVDDCGNDQYSIAVNITDLGSGATAGVRYSVNGGTPVDVTGLGTGITNVGPFNTLDEVSVTLLHGSDAQCNVPLGVFTSNCPIEIVCGTTTTVNYCYKNNDTKTWTFTTNTSGETVTVSFISGAMATGDVIRFYDGTDNTGTMIAGSNYPSLNGVTVTTSPGVSSMFIEIESIGGGSCADGDPTASPWQFEVECTPGCVDPDGAVTVTTDCPSYTFSMDVEVFFTGDGGTCDVEYTVNGGTPVVIPGLVDFDVANIGPFTVGDDVLVRLLHGTDPLCNRTLGTYTDNGTCPPLSENCLSAQNLAQLTSPFSSTTTGWADDLSTYPGNCQTNTSPDRLFYIDVPNGYQLVIGQTVNGYDSENYVGWGGSCPGTTQIACYDDSDIQNSTWTNSTGTTQRVWWVQDGYFNASQNGTFTLAWSLTAPCTGTPAPGATLSSASPVCAMTNFTLSLENPTTAIGITYQWYVSTVSNAGPWTTVPGGNGATLTTTQSVESWYYCAVTCSTGPTTGNSTPIQVGMTTGAVCMCVPTTTGGTTYYVSNFTTTGGITNINNTSGSSATGYQDFTAVTMSAQVADAIGYTMTVAGGGTYGRAIWVDLNEDFAFQPTEQLVTSSGYASSPLTGSFTIPLGTTPGIKRMRILASWTPGNPTNACTNSGTGEYEDYLLEVFAQPSCAGTPAPGNTTGPSVASLGSTINLGLQNMVPGAGISYQWFMSPTSATGPWTAVGTNASTYSPVISGNSWFYCEVTCATGPSMGASAVLAVTGVLTNAVPYTGNNTFACGTNMILTDHAGTGTYSNNANGYTVLDAGDGGIITITGPYTTESGWDYARIYSGAGVGGTLLQTYGGTGTANFTGAPGQTLTVQFTSDGSGTYSGFEFTVAYSGTCFQPCSGTPAPGNTTGPSVAANGSTISLGLQNNTPGNVSYQWYASTTSATGPWTTVGTNAPTYNATITANTWFYCEVTCATGPTMGASTVLAVTSVPTNLVPFTGSNTFACGTNMILRDHADAGNYNNNANGYTVLEAGYAGVISISGNYATESCCDRVYIYSGAGTGGTLLQTYAGNGTANFTGAPGQTLTVQFTSDGSLIYSGFDFMVSYSGQCSAVVCTTDLVLEFDTDGSSSAQNTWELRQQGTGDLIQSGGGLPSSANGVTMNTCLPDGCFYLRVLDSGGDGIANGGYILRTLSGAQRIIDNRDNFTTGSVSAVIGNGGFCLPLGTDQLIYTSCDKLDWVNNQYIVAAPNAAVSAQWGIGDQTDDGYMFWFFDPNGSYGYAKFRNHATSDGFGPANATRACHARINNWSPNQIPASVLMNVKVRSRVNGVNSAWGPVCRFKIDPVRAACPLTKLMDIPGNQFYSCGVTKTWGGNNRIHARPVDGATQYQFRFVNGEIPGGVVRTTTNYYLNLNWTPALPNGTYEVQVRAFKNGAWCVTSLPWGDVCNVTINGSPATMALPGTGTTAAAELAMFPNPNNGDQLTLSLSAVEEGVETVSVDIFDLSGARVVAKVIPVHDGRIYQQMTMNELANGLYMVHITAGDQRYTERLVIAK